MKVGESGSKQERGRVSVRGNDQVRMRVRVRVRGAGERNNNCKWPTFWGTKCGCFLSHCVCVCLFVFSCFFWCFICWLLIVDCWLLFVDCLFVVCCLLFVDCCLLFVDCCLLIVDCWLLFIDCCLLIVVCCLLFVVCCLLFVLSCSLIATRQGNSSFTANNFHNFLFFFLSFFMMLKFRLHFVFKSKFLSRSWGSTIPQLPHYLSESPSLTLTNYSFKYTVLSLFCQACPNFANNNQNWLILVCRRWSARAEKTQVIGVIETWFVFEERSGENESFDCDENNESIPIHQNAELCCCCCSKRMMQYWSARLLASLWVHKPLPNMLLE